MCTFGPTGKLHLYRFIPLFLCAAVMIFSAAVPLHSQTAGTASIQGVVTDESGAVIPNAEITATDTATQVKHVTKSDGNGLYSIPNIAIGSYSVDVAAAGFEHFRKTGVVLDVGSSIAVNVSLKVGAAQTTVEVTSEGIALQTEDATLKQTVDSATLTEMPLDGRQMTNLLVLQGAAVTAPSNDIQGSKTFYSSVVVSVAGGQGNFTDYRMDGADNNDYMTNINLPFPFPDAVAQFSVESTALGANQGLHPGGLVNVVTKSGTNEYHGTAFEFIRNNYIDATNFFSPTRDTLHQNQYGGVFGGPVLRSKLFAFAAFQHTKSDSATADTIDYVPTPAMLAGDFSVADGAGCNPTTGMIQLLNPQTGATLPNDQINATTYFNPIALQIAKNYLPVPTDTACGLYQFAIPNELSENQFVTRTDWTINQKHSAFGRYWRDTYQKPSFFNPANLLITGTSGAFEAVQSLAVGETWVPSPRIVNSFHAAITLRNIQRGPNPAGNVDANTVGISVFQDATDYFPFGATGKWSFYGGGAPAVFVENTFGFGDDVNWVKGKHNIGFGGEFTRSEFNENNIYQSNGAFTFSGLFSKTGPAGTSHGGTGEDANLDFLTGALGGFSQSAPQLDALRAPIPTLYVMDTYHASTKLVLVGGVRWDPEFFPTDKFGRGSTFNMSNFLAGTISTTYPNAPAGSLYYGDPGVPKAYTTGSMGQFSPRVGITYDPTGTGKTVFRFGGSMVYDLVCFFMGQNMNVNAPFSVIVQSTTVGQPLSLAAPWTNGSVIGNPFPRPAVPSKTIAFPKSSMYIVLANHFHPPLMTQFTASVQRELGRGWQVQADYIGNRTSHESYSEPLNDDVYIPGSSSTGNDSARFALTLANPTWGPYYSGGGSGSNLVLTGANSSYEGLVTTVNHRSAHLVFTANYTWSHCIDLEDSQGDTESTTFQNPLNPKSDKGNCGFDYRHVFNTSMVASSYFNFGNHLLSAVVDNWQLSPLIHVQDGAPLYVTLGQDNSLTDVGHDRPNLLNKSLVYSGKKILSGVASNATFLNSVPTGAFGIAGSATGTPTGTFGDEGRNEFRGPKFFQFDTSLVRTFPVRERLQMMLRLEAYNVLNHPSFTAPGTTMSSSTFGVVTAEAGNGARTFQGAVKLIF